MKNFIFNTNTPFHYNWTGKFQAPDENWIHMTRSLTDWEFVIVTEGDFYIGDEEKKSVVHKNQFRLMKPTKFQHGTQKGACSFYWMHFVPEAFEIAKSEKEILDHDRKSIWLPEQADIPHPERLIVLLKQLSDCDKKYSNQDLNDYLCTAILCELSCQLKNLSVEKNGKLHGAQVALFSDIKNYISWKIKEDIRVAEIASYFGYNAKYITTFFKKASGKPIKQFILEEKIEAAKAMLSDSTRPVSQIGYELGFSDNHNFSRAFKKNTGQSPTQFRDTYADRALFNV